MCGVGVDDGCGAGLALGKYVLNAASKKCTVIEGIGEERILRGFDRSRCMKDPG